MYKSYLFVAAFLFLPYLLSSQTSQIEMSGTNWVHQDGGAEFVTFKNAQAMHITSGGEAHLQNVQFSTGIIEFDYHVSERGFCGLYFRRQEGQNRTPDFYSEFFYLRAFKLDSEFIPGVVQYAPIIRGTNLWDLLHDYESSGLIKSDAWNHVKLVISEKQLQCYLNGQMVLWIPELLGDYESGSISIEGQGYYANVEITHGETEELPRTKGADLITHDVRYLKDWKYSPQYSLPKASNISRDVYPDSSAVWKNISSGRSGLLNLTKEIASPFTEQERKVVWLRTTIESEFNQNKLLNLGFSDDIWVFVNEALVYIDMNTYNSPIAKEPNGRLHIENASTTLPLREGSNELLIAVANDFFGWGLVARLENMRGVKSLMKHSE